MLGLRLVNAMAGLTARRSTLLRPFASKYVSPDVGETQYEEIKTEIRRPDTIPSWYFKFDDGKYHVLRSLSDNKYLLLKGVLVPRHAGSAYYSLERNGTIYHVFNAERMVRPPYSGLWPHL